MFGLPYVSMLASYEFFETVLYLLQNRFFKHFEKNQKTCATYVRPIIFGRTCSAKFPRLVRSENLTFLKLTEALKNLSLRAFCSMFKHTIGPHIPSMTLCQSRGIAKEPTQLLKRS